MVATSYYVWDEWCSGTCSNITSTSNTTTTSASTWYRWISSGTATYTNTTVYVQPRNVAPRELTEEEKELAAQRQREYEAERERTRIQRELAQKEREAAEARAQELALENLTEEQKASVKKHGWYVVQGGKTKKQYKIHTKGSVHGNIEELCKDGKKAIASLCVQFKDYRLPAWDNFLAQGLMLQYAEEDLLKTANRSRLAA